jgi:non-lysosomal glucosylceramidase
MFVRRLLSVLLFVTVVAGWPFAATLQVSQAASSIPTARPASAQPIDGIPEAAWSRPIGLPFDNPPKPKVNYPMIDDGPLQGAPLGGIGAGTFARTYAGDFARWHTTIGAHAYQTVPADMFSVYARQGDQSVAQALWTGSPDGVLSAWQWNYPVGAGTYYALYPRSWFVYDWDSLPVDLSVEQFSPIIPGDYQASSYPVALFTWTASNPTDQPVTVGVMLTWMNPIGNQAGRIETIRSQDTSGGRIVGVEMGNQTPFKERPDQGTFAIAVQETPGVTASYRAPFESRSDGADIWQDFAADGALDNVIDTTPATRRDAPAAGLAITFELQPGQTLSAPFAVGWDQPVMTFGSGESWYKRYTAFFGRDGAHAWDIASEGLARADEWRAAIEAWQTPILADGSTPLWYKTALFNELYYVADGGAAWEHGRVGEPDPGPDYLGHFAYLECFDYLFYDTFDVDFYASFALLELWPEIEVSIMRDFAATIPQDDPRMFIVGYTGKAATRKIAGAVPHDLGSPAEAPWSRPNAFTWQDSNGWKDLNAKYVLRLYRDVVLLNRPDLATDLWPSAVEAMDYLAAMDTNGDGVPENAGIPDQTYDTWPATGVSAYSGGLWLGALAAMREMARLVGDESAAETYAAALDKARAVYEDTLWTGEYYRYDEMSNAIMADQLAGEWYLRIAGLSVLPDERVDSALKSIFAHNVQQFQDGQMGAVNGMYPDGKVVVSEQAAEVWTGTTYMLAAHMLLRGLDEEAWGSAYGIYQQVYETDGLWFRTPEAWDATGNFRASMYMRPLAIWAMQTALTRR